MTRRDDVMRMAREAGITIGSPPHQFCIGDFCSIYSLERFAAVVAAAERERCAKEAAAIRDDYVATGSNKQACAADYIAERIRALKGGVE